MAAFETLLSRLTHNVRLPGPNRAECISFARSIWQDEELVRELADFGVARTNLRSMAIAARSAAQRAGDGSVSVTILRTVIRAMGGK